MPNPTNNIVPASLGNVTAADLADNSIAELGTRDHDLLAGLTDDDHSQYGLLAGRAGSQTFIGGTATGEDLTLRATANAVGGNILFQSDPTTTVATFADTEITATVPVIAANLKAHALVENRSPTASTASTTFVTLESASAVTFSGRPLLCFVNATMFPSVADLTVELAVQIDAGADIVAAQLLHNETEHNTVQGAVIVTPTAGSHTLRVRWRISAGAGTLTLDGNDQILLHAIEL